MFSLKFIQNVELIQTNLNFYGSSDRDNANDADNQKEGDEDDVHHLDARDGDRDVGAADHGGVDHRAHRQYGREVHQGLDVGIEAPKY